MNKTFNTEALDNQFWIDGYTQSLQHLSVGTVDAYVRVIRQFMGWLEQMPGGSEGFHPEQLTKTAVSTYIKQLENDHLSLSHLVRVKSAISAFSKWLMEEHRLLQINPTRGIDIPEQALLAPRILSPDQRYILKNLVERDGTKRSAALFALGYWAGCRVSDSSFLLLHNTHLGPKIGSLYVGHKGNKMRNIPIMNEVRKPLYEYIESERSLSKFSSSKYVFLSKRGEQLSDKGIHHWLRTLKSNARKDEWLLIEDITYHDLRHDFAHRAREAGWPLEYVSVYLGHITKRGLPAIETTVRYTQPSQEGIREKLKDMRG
ncbi:tyrosine-type recombinase/integrase [Bacillus sp. FJAT-28004]|uniref:tyrosine-type recombinase/integrase n=1 Tax=Bacillus sp. FJAT-28004 TaxID=1679165 RepID=UPI0006B46809|nr:tyrosine-type recombinase/integrase [Bacillus sp. FJAT-28004]